MEWFRLFWLWSGCDWLWLAEKIYQEWKWVFFLVNTTRPSCKAMCTITTKQHNSPVLVPRMNIQHVKVGFAHFTVVETRIFVNWKVKTILVWTCWTIHTSKNLLNWFSSHFRQIISLTKVQEKQMRLFFKRNFAHLTRGRALRTLIVASTEKLKIPFVPAKYFRTHCIRTKYVSNKFINAIVIKRIRGACATHRKCSHLVHTFLKRNNCSRTGAESRDGYVWQFL